MALLSDGKRTLLETYKVLNRAKVGNYTGSTANKETSEVLLNWIDMPVGDINEISTENISFLSVSDVVLNGLSFKSNDKGYDAVATQPTYFAKSFWNANLLYTSESSIVSPYIQASNGHKFVLFHVNNNFKSTYQDIVVNVPEGFSIGEVYDALETQYPQWAEDPISLIRISADDGLGTTLFTAIEKSQISHYLQYSVGETIYGMKRTNNTQNLNVVIPFSDSGQDPIEYEDEGTLLIEEVKIITREI